MKWALLIDTHLNMDNVIGFFWEHSWLKIQIINGESMQYYDPDRELYLKLCRSQGVRPYEEDDNGQNVTD